MTQKQLTLVGPFALSDHSKHPNIFGSPLADAGGVYLWTVQCGRKYWVNYVGKASHLKSRLRTECSAFRAFESWVYDPAELRRGVKKPVFVPGNVMDHPRSLETTTARMLEIFRIFVGHVPSHAGRRRIERELVCRISRGGLRAYVFLDNAQLRPRKGVAPTAPHQSTRIRVTRPGPRGAPPFIVGLSQAARDKGPVTPAAAALALGRVVRDVRKQVP